MRTRLIFGTFLIAISAGAIFLWFERSESSPAGRAVAVVQPSISTGEHSAKLPSAAPPRRSAELPTIPNAEADAVAGLDSHMLTKCHRELLKRSGIEKMNCERLAGTDPQGSKQCQKRMEFLRAQMEQASAASAPCPASLAHPSTYYRAVRDLAKRGDIVAQRCLIQGYFGINRELGIDLSPADLEEYAKLARKFIDSGLTRGDWSIVRWLSKTRVEMPDLLLASAYPMGFDDRVNAYKVRRLLMLGKQPGLGILEQDDPARLVEHWRKEKWLSPTELEEAESWAQKMYQQHFIGSVEGAEVRQADFCPGE